jgi:S-adenosylmethionine decarboxylase
MFFEGSEKKFEVIAQGSNFLKRPREHWERLVELAGAKILSQISTPECTAFLLSESSLFVWDDRITMITCGRTTLADALSALLSDIPEGRVQFLTYERKNEYYPHRQQSDFYRDVELLQTRVKGQALRFGTPDEHHLYLYHLDQPYRPQGVDATLEVLMYNLQGPAVETLARTRLDTLFPGFLIDDHQFDPCGYSLNALKGSEYFTLHVTPEEMGSYVSFETNMRLGNRISTALRSVVEVFQPKSFDVIYFHPERELKAFDVQPFRRRQFFRERLSCGFEVSFASYYLDFPEAQKPLALKVT